MVIFNRPLCQPLSNGNLPPLIISFEPLGHASFDYRLAAHQSSDERVEPSRLEIRRKPKHTILLCQADTFIGRGDDEADRNRPFMPGCTAGDRPDQPEPRTGWPVSLRLFSSQLWSYCFGPATR
jgi:hypothetical protein